MLRVNCGFRTDVGRVRGHNEDSVLAGERLWVVADGMGGHAAGDVASALVIDRLRALDRLPEIRPADLINALNEANASIMHHSDVFPETRGLGSTVTGIARVVVGGADHWAIFNVGDSRVYRVMGDSLARATIDHSETEEMVLEGVISADEARTHRLRNVITRSLGQPMPPQVDLWLLPQTAGERFLVCSDGLTGEVPDADIAAILHRCPDPAEAADQLVDAALAHGGRDNISVIVFNVEGTLETDVDEVTNPRGMEKEHQ